MSEHVEDQNTPEDNTPQYTEIELKAMDQGWRPKEEFDGDPDRFIDAAEFIRRGELFEKIERQNRELKQMKQTMEQFKLHHAKVEKSAYDRAIADLKRQRKEALAEGDVDLYDELDDNIEKLKDERDQFVEKATRAVQPEPTINPEFQAWMDRNQWYNTDPIMRGAADAYGIALAREGKTPDEVLKLVEKRMREEFSHKFKNPNRERASAVEAPQARGGERKVKYHPTDLERKIAKNFVQQGLYKTEADYYAELAKMNGE